METLLTEICAHLRATDNLSDKALASIIRAHNRDVRDNRRHFAKKKLLPYYFKVKESDPKRWAAWGIDAAMEQRLIQTLRLKPRRTASGVATITVITKPWPCASNCLYCPNDLRVPKSYLSDEPACQRAERNYFDPYLQVAARLRTLTQMGHTTDKIELIILGGTWSDYPQQYQIWFVKELFRALNNARDAQFLSQGPHDASAGCSREQGGHSFKARRRWYRRWGLHTQPETVPELLKETQRHVNAGTLTYNQAIERLYGLGSVWEDIATQQVSDLSELAVEHHRNESAQHRVVGLAIETRPDAVTPENLNLLRRLGCTKVQMGIQSLNAEVLALNNRTIDQGRIYKAFALLRLFGFKLHAHFMVNLYGSSPDLDIRDYQRLVTEAEFLPDEIKLYPCALVNGTGLCKYYASGAWRPYSQDELVKVLTADLLNTPAYVRISRMIRDISAHDILAGNKKTNLRQMVEANLAARATPLQEIRYREISTDEIDISQLSLATLAYVTTISREYFLQWLTPTGRIAGFLRLSLPHAHYVHQHQLTLPIKPLEAMIREVHIYGRVVGLRASGEGAQHIGLGKQLIAAACSIALSCGYERINVISSVGTRHYYRSLGFSDRELYQQKSLIPPAARAQGSWFLNSQPV